MRKVIFLLAMISTLALVSCGPSKPLTPEEQAVLDAQIKKYTEMFEKKSFVLEATTVYSKKGRSFQLNPSINFVKIDDGVGTVQLSFNQLVGWNGVGGITLDGNVRNYKVKKAEGKMPSVQFDLNGTLGWATVRIDVNSSGIGRATINTGTSGARATFSGPIVPLSETSTYQGQTLF